MKPLGLTEYFVMHSFIYKTQVLRDSNTKLLHHTFYVDNIFVYEPMIKVKDMYYIDCDFYRYLVGRPDQSITLANMTKRYAHQVRVMDCISNVYSYDELYALEKHQRKFMIHDLITKEYLTLFYVYTGNEKERKELYKEYWKHFKENNNKLYKKIRFKSYFFFQSLLIPPLRKLAITIGYKMIIKSTGWN